MAPTAPILTAPTDGASVTSPLSISGTGEDGTVTIYDGLDVLVASEATGGAFSAEVTLAPGAHRLWADAQAGADRSASSNEVNVTVAEAPAPPPEAPPATADVPAPTPSPAPAEPAPTPEATPAPEVAAPPVRVAAPVIEEPHDGQELEDSLVTVSGTAEPSGATVTVYADSASIGSASVDNVGDWSLSASLPNGQYELSATLDDTGRVSERSAAVAITVNFDASAPTPAPPSDPSDRFAAFLEERILRGYPLNWELIQNLRSEAQRWIDSRSA